MTEDRPSIRLEGDEKTCISAGWGRSGKRAIITVANPSYENPRQVILTPDQAEQLGRFLSAGPDT